MKLFGSISELVSVIWRKNSQAITLRPNQATTYTASRDIQTPAQDTDSVLVSRDSTDTLTNKTISGSSNTLTVLAATQLSGATPIANGGTGQTGQTAAFDALAPTTTKGDLIVHNGTDNIRIAVGATNGQVLQVDSAETAGVKWADAGGGSGEKNYVGNPSALSAITGWTAIGDLVVARTTTAAELPREYTTGAGIKITADADTQSTADYVYYDFTLDDVDLSKKLKIQWSQKVTGTYTNGQLAVVITTQADRTTALHTPVVTEIPSADGVFTTSFDASTTSTLSLVIRATTDMTTNGGIVISDVIVGPGTQPQGAVVSGPTNYTATTPNSSLNNTTTIASSLEWRRVGNNMHLQGHFDTGIVQASEARISLPTGYTIGSTAGSSAIRVIGKWARDSATATSFKQGVVLATAGTTYLNFAADDYTTASSPDTPANANALFGTERVFFDGEMVIPIAEWAGSGTISMLSDETLTEWQNYTPTISGVTGGTQSTSARWRRVGANMEVVVDTTYSSIFTGGDTPTYTLPSGYTIDTTALPSGTSGQTAIGAGTLIDVSAAVYPAVVVANAGTTFSFYSDTSPRALVHPTAPYTWANGDKITGYLCVPITEWRGRSNGAVGFALASTTAAGLVNPYSTSGGVVYSGTYTPVLTNTLNIGSSSVNGPFNYIRVGARVHVSGILTITASTAANTKTLVELTLPISSNLTNSYDLTGHVCADNSGGTLQYSAGFCSANTGNDRAYVEYAAARTASTTVVVSFVYEIK